MKTIVSFFSIIGLLATASASAQTLTVVEERQFNLDALRTLENYESCATLYGNAARMDFDLLFNDRSLHIFNDLNGLSAAPTLSVADYSELLSSKGRSTQVIIKNLRKGTPYYDGEWKLDVTFDKEITYANNCEILFSSRNYFGADFHISMTLVWDQEMRQCTISRLEGERGSEVEMLPSDYVILTHSDDNDYKLTVNGDSLHFNSFGQMFLPANPLFSFPDYDVRVKAIPDNVECNTIKVVYMPKRWRIKPHFDLGIGNFYYGEGNISLSSSGYEAGLDLGYIFPSKGSLKTGFFIGAGISMSQLNLSSDKVLYDYQAEPNADIDGDTYRRFYEVSGLAQTVKMTDLIVPVYLDFDVRFSKSVSLYFDAGAQLYLNLKNEVSGMSGTYSSWGYYEQYGITLRENVNWAGSPINGFVNNKQISTVAVNSSSSINKISVDVLGRGGFRILLWRDLFLDISASYQMSVLNPFESSDAIFIGAGTTTESQALMTYDINSGENLRSLCNGFSSLRRQSLKACAGLIYRF